ncbi:hypothetical protein MRX96_054486 [Rhipicephalus microplus]
MGRCLSVWMAHATDRSRPVSPSHSVGCLSAKVAQGYPSPMRCRLSVRCKCTLHTPGARFPLTETSSCVAAACRYLLLVCLPHVARGASFIVPGLFVSR